MRVYEERVPRTILGPKREEVTGGWRRLRNEELHNLYASLNIIMMIKSRKLRCSGDVSRMGETRNVYSTFLVKSVEKRHLGRPRSR
jgi:hypothetical protein